MRLCILMRGIYESIDSILSGGSLGSWVDEERGQPREIVRIADTKNIDVSNAYCGIEPSQYHAYLRVELIQILILYYRLL